ncbi:MAG: SAM-dependent chlorinase/fluorinase [Acidobacteria bacterium]|nr:SAM-dependent chlorinase/fluorinase [Acidobacteriota bacterium]
MRVTGIRERSFANSVRVIIYVLLVTSWLGAAESASQDVAPILVFMTDFGVLDDSVAICKGVMLSVDPGLRIVDLSHQVTPYSILDGARYLFGASPYYPSSTIFVAVVDPGVGSTRRAIVVKSKRGQLFVLPDNGLITLVADRDGLEGAHEITSPDWMVGSALSSTFHGRDIFSPVGAHLARGEDWTRVGPEIAMGTLVRLSVSPAKIDQQGVRGDVIATDGPFGNLITNISGAEFLKLGYQQGQSVQISIAGTGLNLPFVRTFSDVARNRPLLYIDSRGNMALAINQGNFAATYRIKPPSPISIKRANNGRSDAPEAR